MKNHKENPEEAPQIMKPEKDQANRWVAPLVGLGIYLVIKYMLLGQEISFIMSLLLIAVCILAGNLIVAGVRRMQARD